MGNTINLKKADKEALDSIKKISFDENVMHDDSPSDDDGPDEPECFGETAIEAIYEDIHEVDESEDEPEQPDESVVSNEACMSTWSAIKKGAKEMLILRPGRPQSLWRPRPMGAVHFLLKRTTTFTDMRNLGDIECLAGRYWAYFTTCPEWPGLLRLLIIIPYTFAGISERRYRDLVLDGTIVTLEGIQANAMTEDVSLIKV